MTYSDHEKKKEKTLIQTVNSRSKTSYQNPQIRPQSPRNERSNLLRNTPLYSPTDENLETQQDLEKRTNRRDQFRKDYPLADKILKNIETDENDPKTILESLKKEFIESVKSIFEYNMTPTSADDFLKGTKKGGDCGTLAKAYIKIAKDYFGIKLDLGYKGKDFFVPGGGKVLDVNGARGNVDTGEHWAFANHYWVESSIGSIDLLFLGEPVDQSKWIDRTGEDKEDGIEYRTFGSYKVYDSDFMSMSLADKYATNLDKAKTGKENSELKAAMAVKKTQNQSSSCSIM